MRGDTLVDYGADFDVSWVFHDFGWEVPLIFLTLRIDMFGGAFLDRCGRIGGDWDCGFNYKACVCVAYFILTWML
jgi:hypothetical protein